MYIPKHNLMTDRNEAIAFMKAYSFASVVTAKDNFPTVTHLPLVIKEENGEVIITGHFSKANKQWQEIENNNVLIVFSEPHAYISPKHYDGELNVPTWNYVAVHAYGKGEIMPGEVAAIEALEEMIGSFEKAYEVQWNSMPEDYKRKMLNGIVCFRLRVTDLQAKKKLSQNRKENERERIITSLENSNDGAERSIAALMKENEEQLK